MRHVAGGIDMDQHADEGNHEQHDDGELIDLQREIDAEGAGDHPGEIVADVGNLIGAQLKELANELGHGEKGKRDGADGDGVDRRLRPALAEKAVDRRTGERQRENDPEMAEYRHQNLSRFTRSTLRDSRLRRSMITIARPTAASAAATTITKKTKTNPSNWLYARANATNARLTALSISSTDMKTVMTLRLKTNATTPKPNRMALSTR